MYRIKSVSAAASAVGRKGHKLWWKLGFPPWAGGTQASAEAASDQSAQRLKNAVAATPRLHLACGRNIILTWVNVDLDDCAEVIGWDLRKRLPIANGTVDFVYAEHFIEHISLDDGERLMRECHRVLKPGGVVRLSTPDLAFVVEKYQQGDISEWANMGWLPSTPCRMLNEGMRLWGHNFVYDRPELHALLGRAGFKAVIDVPWRESRHEVLNGVECRSYHHELIVEAIRD